MVAFIIVVKIIVFSCITFIVEDNVTDTAERPKHFTTYAVVVFFTLTSLTMAFTGKFVYIWFTISSCYGSVPLALASIGRDDGLSTLCHSCRFACQQRVLKTFPGPGYLRFGDGVV